MKRNVFKVLAGDSFPRRVVAMRCLYSEALKYVQKHNYKSDEGLELIIKDRFGKYYYPDRGNRSKNEQK